MEVKSNERHLVNPVAVRNCSVTSGEFSAPILDISFMRVVVEEKEPWPGFREGEPITLEFHLDRQSFSALVVLHARKDGWARLGFEKIVPSAHAHLRSFLSPKKIGESIIEGGQINEIRHYHGLNEAELWSDPTTGILFTYMEPLDPRSQFILRILNGETSLKMGKIRREDYMSLSSLTAELPLTPLTDREVYSKLGECRDIVTNFRPAGQMEYNLKQRLLKVISDHLYSTGNRFEHVATLKPKMVSTAVDGQ